MAFAEHLEDILAHRRVLLDSDFRIRGNINRALQVVVLGTGAWANRYRLQFQDYALKSKPLVVTYVDTVLEQPDPEYREGWVRRLHSHEDEESLESDTFSDISEVVVADWCNPCKPVINTLTADVLLVATPDSTHTAQVRRWLGSAGSAAPSTLVIVEKPFATTVVQIDELVEALNKSVTPLAVRGIDHYLTRAHLILGLTEALAKHMSEITDIKFRMWEEQPIEGARIPSLQMGLTYDLASHFLGILTLIAGEELPIVEFEDAGQHEPLVVGGTWEEFAAETYSDLRFDLEVPFQNDPIRCVSEIGKGQPKTIKCMDILGNDGSLVRLDFTKSVLYSTKSSERTFPNGCLLLARIGDTESGGVDPHGLLKSLETLGDDDFHEFGEFEYGDVLRSVTGDRSDVLSTLIPIYQARWIVGTLERMHALVLANKDNWENHPVGARS